MNLNALLARIDLFRRNAATNVRNVLSDPVATIENSLARYAGQYLPTKMELEDARSVMPGMGNALSEKVMGMAMPLGTVIKPPITAWGGPMTGNVERVLFDGRKADTSSMSFAEQWLTNAYAGRLAEGFPPNRAAEWAAMHGAFHPQVGPEYVSSIMPRLSPAPTMNAEIVPMPPRWTRFK